MTSAEEFNCILCKEKFDNKDELQIHFRRHGDPKFNESIKTKGRVQNETPIENEKSNDAPEMVNCDVCDEVFPTISKAITHKHKVHPDHDAKYFCPWCGKLFTMKHLYNKHLYTNHDATEEALESKDMHFQCDSCNVFFLNPPAMVYHNKFFHRQDTDLPIIGHSKKQKLFNQDLLPLYYCSFCGEEYINKVNLHKHICDDHGDENQRPTDVLRCPLCEAIFYHLDAYELHLTFHSSDDLYSETNEMNENEMSEFSLETVPPLMERIEDLNNLPDVETDTNALGIESFLQMAMDVPKDNDQYTEKVKSKKHKKHKKSKKPAITLDEFLSMNQDVFGEDLDFQGIEEVPTKVIKNQLKVKKTPIPKIAAKIVSSADLQKLQKQGIVVKVQSSNKPQLSQVRPIGQPVKVNAQVKNLGIQTKTKTISASNEVLSKLLNQSSNQLKIVKKSAQEKTHNDDSDANEVMTDNLRDRTQNENLESMVMSPVKMYDNGDEKEKKCEDQNHLTLISSPQKSPTNNGDNKEINADETSVTDRDSETQNKYENVNSNENNKTQQIYHISSTNINPNVSGNNNSMNDTLKSIGKHITIKPINKARIEGKPDEISTKPEINDKDVDENGSPSIDLNVEQKDVKQSKSLDAWRNLNSAITIKSLKPATVHEPDKNITSSVNKTDNIIKQPIKNNTESTESPIQQLKLVNSSENVVNKCDSIKEKPVQVTPSSHQVLKNISKNITIKSMSTTMKQVKDDEDNDIDKKSVENKDNNSIVSSTLDRLKNETPGQVLNSAGSKQNYQSPYALKRICTNIEERISDNEICATDEELKNTNIQSGNNLLKHLKNITAKPIPVCKGINQEVRANSNNKIIHGTKGNIIKKSVQTKEINQDIEIFNIDDSDDEIEPSKIDNSETAPVKIEPTKPGKSESALNAIKNMSRNVTIKSSNQIILNEINKRDESNEEHFSDEDDVHNNAKYDSNDDFEDESTSHTENLIPTQKDKTMFKDGSLKSVLKNLGKHITVKSGNASPSPSIRSLDQSSQDFYRNTTANDIDSDEEYCSSKVKITEISKEDEGDIDQTDDFVNAGAIVQSPEDSHSGDERFPTGMEELDECEDPTVNIRLNQNFKPTNEGLLKNISKNITIKTVSDRNVDNEDKICKTDLADSDSITNQPKLSKELLMKHVKQNKPDEEKSRPSNMSDFKRLDVPSSTSLNVHSQQAKPNILNTVNKEVKVKTFQSETVIEEITTTVTKTIRRVNQTVNHQVFNSGQTSSTARMIRPKLGPRMPGSQTNNLQGVTVRQSTPGPVRPKIRQAIPFRPACGTIVRPSNQLVPIRPSVNQIRSSNTPRTPVKNMPRQQRPVGRPLKISPNVVNHTLKRPGNDEPPGHFSCFKKPKESLIPGNDTATEACSEFKYASSSQVSKFSNTTQSLKGNLISTSTQMKTECLSQQQQINRLSNVSGLKIAKTNQVSKVERTEINASKRTTLEAIEKLQKQGLLIKKPRVEEDTDLPNSGDEDNEEFDGDYDE